MLFPALAIFQKARTIPVTVPKNPNIGAPLEMVAMIDKPFSSLATSMFPVFSMAACTSATGRPIRVIPFSIIRAEGVFVMRQ